MSNYFVR
jgi:hypothetical protein